MVTFLAPFLLTAVHSVENFTCTITSISREMAKKNPPGSMFLSKVRESIPCCGTLQTVRYCIGSCSHSLANTTVGRLNFAVQDIINLNFVTHTTRYGKGRKTEQNRGNTYKDARRKVRQREGKERLVIQAKTRFSDPVISCIHPQRKPPAPRSRPVPLAEFLQLEHGIITGP